MEPWPSSIVMLRAHIYLSSWTFTASCVTSSHASKGPLRCRPWTFEFPLYCALCTPHFILHTLHSNMTLPIAQKRPMLPSHCQASFRPLPLPSFSWAVTVVAFRGGIRNHHLSPCRVKFSLGSKDILTRPWVIPSNYQGCLSSEYGVA